jgi:hypothetical protein
MAEKFKTMRISILSALNKMENRDNIMVCMMLGQTKQLIEDLDQWREMMGAIVKAMRSLGEEDIHKIMAQMAATGGMGGGTPGDGFGALARKKGRAGWVAPASP